MKSSAPLLHAPARPRLTELRRVFIQNYQLWLIALIPLVWLILFKYWPMYGAQIAFRNYRAVDGIWGSRWAGINNFLKLFRNYMFPRIIKNTLIVSFYQLLISFPFPVILALALHNTLRSRFKKTVQMVTYMPHFISTVVLVGMIMQFTNPHVGLINKFIAALGGTARDFMASPTAFYHIYVWSNVWQNCGWGTIIYLAALSGVNMDLHEAAMIDGASRFKRMLHIDIPCIIPTAVVLLIMDAGRIMSLGFEKAFLMQNLMNISASEIISTYAYKVGLAQAAADFSYSTTISLFNSVINMILITIVNALAAKWGETSLW
ncbi:MAG: ABC transporter permease subunit [Treponema sp.]|jgi:ABC-type polysaccharide transport system permease subunit|nr:ABC transporter permease subunit [Treponema sp.]